MFIIWNLPVDSTTGSLSSHRTVKYAIVIWLCFIVRSAFRLGSQRQHRYLDVKLLWLGSSSSSALNLVGFLRLFLS